MQTLTIVGSVLVTVVAALQGFKDGFESDPVGGPPRAWVLPEFSAEAGYRLEVTDASAAGGQRCARLSGARSRSAVGVCQQAIDAQPLRAKRVRFSAAVRCEPEDAASGARLWLRVDRPKGQQGFLDNKPDLAIRSDQWQRYEIVGDVADDADQIVLGMLLIGSGTAMLDDVVLEVVDGGVPTTRPAPGLVVAEAMTIGTPATAVAQAVHTRSFGELWLCSGVIGPLLTLAGCLALVIALRLWLELRPGRLAPAALQQSLEVALHKGDLDAGLESATKSRTVLGGLVAAGLLLRHAGLDEMLANIERATTREALRLGNRVANLARIGGAVLLVGLFGTVTSLMSMLQVIEILKYPTLGDFARGILESLVSVALGLFVALFCFVAFFWLDSRLTQRTLAVRDIAEELIHDAADKAR